MAELNLSSVYDPKSVEEKWLEFWQKNGYYKAKTNPDKTPFCITIPPPNVTGDLHMGHALQHAIHDAVLRRKRMLGFETLCVPGTDHAGIGTQMKVEQALLRDEGKTKYDLGREEFLSRVWEWKEFYGGSILRQLKKFGASYDWERERFTMDDDYVTAVLTAFTHLYNKGLIYRGTRIINWCCHCETAISDLEVEYEDQASHLWHLKYPLADGSGEIIVATTRPETMLGDTAVAVNPDDERYKQFIGKTVMLPIVNREIPVIADDYVNLEFGTGAVKVTPAHDPNDAEMGIRHKLPAPVVIGKDGRITEEGMKFVGMDRYDARKEVVAAFKELGLLEKIEDYAHSVGICSRCHTTIEPLLSEQWFVSMKPLAEHVLKAIKEGNVQYQPSRFAEYSVDWLNNIKDWCISRQLWWGHRVPVYVCSLCGHEFASVEKSESCPKCCGPVEQDPDVLDTWFSSALWPFAVLGWPNKMDDLAYFYPTDLMITGRDILYLWIVRMIFSSMEYLPEMPKEGIPFKQVYVHPTVQNYEGKRMSKSLGTGVDPLELMEKYGTDATRYGLCGMATATQDVRLQEQREEGWSEDKAENGREFPSFIQGRNFATKIWNASRFAIMNIGENVNAEPTPQNIYDRYILSKYAKLAEEVNLAMDDYRLDTATSAIYSFFWNDFCDWYLELSKPVFKDTTNLKSRAVLSYVLENFLRLLHPFMPFITEEIWQQLPHAEGAQASIMVSDYPQFDCTMIDDEAERQVALLQDIITGVRKIRANDHVPPAAKVDINITAKSLGTAAKIVEESSEIIAIMARGNSINIAQSEEMKGEAIFYGDETIFVNITRELSLEEKAQEAKKLEKELEKLVKDADSISGRLSNAAFVEKAPPQVIEKNKSDLEALNAKIEIIRTKLTTL